MSAGTTEKQAADGRLVAGPIENRAHGEKRIKGEFAMENVAASETVNRFEVMRSDDLHVFDEAGQIVGVLRESFDYSVPEILPAGTPVRFGLDHGFAIRGNPREFERSELNVRGKDMLAFGRERRIENRGNSYIKMRRWREFAVFGGVESAFEIIDFRSDVDTAGEGVEKPFSRIECGENGETAEGEMNFCNGACGANVANAKREGGIELGGI